MVDSESTTSLASHLEDIDEDIEMTARCVKSPTPELVMSSESPASLISSLSSTASMPLAQSLLNKKTRASAPATGTLTDSKNVYRMRGPRRR